MSDAIEIAGLPVTLVSQEEAGACSAVVCGSRSYFPDDVQTTCSICGTKIFHRPHAPKTPPKMCITCQLAQIDASGQHRYPEIRLPR